MERGEEQGLGWGGFKGFKAHNFYQMLIRVSTKNTKIPLFDAGKKKQRRRRREEEAAAAKRGRG